MTRPSRRHSRVAVPIVAGLAAAALVGSALGTPGATANPAALADEHAPTSDPDRITATLAGDPTTSRAVSWRTDDAVDAAEAQIAPVERWTGFAEDATSVPATTTPLPADRGYTNHYHSAEFTGLEPDTQYLYRVGDPASDTWSEWIEFETAEDGDEPFRFAFIGDAQNDIEEHFSRVARRAYGLDPELVVHPGDLLDVADRDGEWGEWTGAMSPDAASVPSLVVPGNHEYFRTGGGRELSDYWRLQFALPDNGPEGHEDFAGTVYSTDYQGVRFIGLNSARNEAEPGNPAGQREFLDAQAAWLEEQLADNPNEWTVVFFHHPTYSTAEGRDNPDVRQRWKPLMEEYGVDLVLSGHDHTYGRGYTRDSRRGRNLTGPMYVNSVSGPKMYEVSGEVWRQNGAVPVTLGEDTQLYHLVTVDDGELELHGYDATGQWYDGFRLRQSGGDRNRVTELDESDSPE